MSIAAPGNQGTSPALSTGAPPFNSGISTGAAGPPKQTVTKSLAPAGTASLAMVMLGLGALYTPQSPRGSTNPAQTAS